MDWGSSSKTIWKNAKATNIEIGPPKELDPKQEIEVDICLPSQLRDDIEQNMQLYTPKSNNQHNLKQTVLLAG